MVTVPLYDRVGSALIATQFQCAAEKLSWLSELPTRLKHPEFREIYLEAGRSEEFLRRAICGETNCVDVGCHLGSMLQKIVQLAPNGHHIAIEPIPYKAAWLRRKFPGIEVHQVAVGDEEGSVEFFINTRRSGFSGLRPHGPFCATCKIEAACKRLDNIVQRRFKVGFLKVDVEGGEYLVFRGAERILTEDRPIVLFECGRSGLRAFGLTARQVYSLLTVDVGYQIFLLKDWLSGGMPLDVVRFEMSMNYPFQAFRYVAFP